MSPDHFPNQIIHSRMERRELSKLTVHQQKEEPARQPENLQKIFLARPWVGPTLRVGHLEWDSS